MQGDPRPHRRPRQPPQALDREVPQVRGAKVAQEVPSLRPVNSHQKYFGKTRSKKDGKICLRKQKILDSQTLRGSSAVQSIYLPSKFNISVTSIYPYPKPLPSVSREKKYEENPFFYPACVSLYCTYTTIELQPNALQVCCRRNRVQTL